MTAPQLMDYLAARIQAALPGWQVFPYPLPETAIAGPVVELGMGSSAIADWRLSGPGLQETLLIALSAPVKPHPDSYRALLDARDAVVRVLHAERGYLLDQKVELGPPGTGMGTLEAPQPVSYADSSQGWRVMVAVQLRRSV